MNRRRLALILCGAAITLAGCADQGPAFARAYAAHNNATIYVYRPYSYDGVLLRPAVTCGDETVRIGPGGYHAFVVPAGKTVCSVETEAEDQVELGTDPRVYYIREEIGWGVLIGHPHLNPIDTDTAQTEIQKCVREP
ncbi:MAG TPA: hypothetical protein VND20_09175 [Candidatus Binataceae bacterium]|nr:hypothetical protein [Candidatus Binataceae bacterium]